MFILHIGLPKTGTTAIQKFLYDNRKKLLEEHSVLYPKNGIVSIAHHLYAYSQLPGKRKLYEKRIRENINFIEIYNSLMEEIRLLKPKIVILSSENFSLFNKEKIIKFKKLFDLPVDYIICYLRRQDLMVESDYRQVVKAYDSKLSDHFVKYINRWVERGNYYALLSNWREVFPEAEIIPRIYDRKLFPEGNVILDFLSVLGIDMPEARTTKIEANPSLSYQSTLVMRRINEEFNLNDQDRNEVVNYLLKLDREEGSIIKTFFTLQERLEFLNRFKESNEKLFREYFGCENKFVLSEEEIKFYKEQDKIPKEVIEKAIEERYRKVFEFMKAIGILMKEKLFPKVRINYLPNSNLELFRIDFLQANLLNGRLVIGGLALPKKDIEEMPKLTIRDAEGVKEIQWGLPSPVLGEQHPDNPKAKNARFKINNILPLVDKPIEICLGEEKIAILEIRKDRQTKINEVIG